MISQILSFGYLPAVFLTGYWVVSNPLKPTTSQLNPLYRIGISVTIGMMLWFPLLFAASWFNFFNPSWIGSAGWIVSLFLALRHYEKLRLEAAIMGSWESWGIIAFALVIFIFNATFASESILGGRDQGLYSTHGVHIAKTGALRIAPPYEKLYEGVNYQIAAPTNSGGFFYDIPRGDMYLQFPPTFAIHLAQFFGIGNYEVLLLFNPLVASISILIFFGLARLFVGRSWAYLATSVFALNASQMWNARITLSEILAQSLILGGIGLAVAAYRAQHRLGFSVACVVASSAAFTRVDGFVIPSFIIVANIVLFSFGSNPLKEIKILKAGSITALATLLLAYTYNYLTSPLYFLDFVFEVNLLVALSIAGLIGLVSIEKLDPQRKFVRLLASPTVLNLIVVLIVLLAAYALLLRPLIEPFSQFADSHYGTRNYRENSIVDLSKYISIPTIIFALIGSCIVLIGLRNNGKPETLLLLVPWLGFSLIYLYDPRISADHIWRIRRFTPLIIPGFVLFATIGISFITTKYFLPNRQKYSYFFAIGWCCIFLLTSLNPIAFLKQYRGSLDTIRSISKALPNGALTLANVSSEILGPLQLAEGHKMIRDHLDAKTLSTVTANIVKQEFEQGREVFLLTELPQGNSNYAIPVGFWKHYIPRLEKTPTPPAREINIQKRNLYLYQFTSGINEITSDQSYYSFGGTPDLDVEEDGLYDQEFNESVPFRWTNGDAHFTLNTPIARDPVQLILKFYATHPDGSDVTISINGQTIFDDPVNEENLTITRSLEGFAFNKSGNGFHIVSDKWKPSDIIESSTDTRELGVAIADITLMFDESILFGNARFGNLPVRGIEESGLYPVEIINNRYTRWTTGHALFAFELRDNYKPDYIELDIAGVRDLGRSVKVRWNNQLIYEGPLSPELETLTLKLEGEKTTSRVAKIEVICEPFVPAELGLNSDNRPLGLRIAGIRLKSENN